MKKMSHSTRKLPTEPLMFRSNPFNKGHFLRRGFHLNIHKRFREVEKPYIPFYGKTTNQRTYTPKEVIERPQLKPETPRVKVPFNDATTYKVFIYKYKDLCVFQEVHAPIEIKRQHPKPKPIEKPQLPPLDTETTTRVSEDLQMTAHLGYIYSQKGQTSCNKAG